MRYHRVVLVLVVLLQCCKTAPCQAQTAQGVSDAFREVHRLSLMSQEITDRWGKPQASKVKTLLQETEKALGKFPNDRSLLWLKGYCLTELGQLDEAEQVFQRLLAQSPPSSARRAGVRAMLAWIQWKRGDYNGAWQNFLAEFLLRKLAWQLLPFLLLAVLARAAQRWIGGWVQLQVWTSLLLALWHIVVTHLTAWLVLGVPFATVVGNGDSYELLSNLFFWTGVLLFTYLYRQRYAIHLPATRPEVPTWVFTIALILGMSVPAYSVFRLYMIGFSPDIPRTLEHITVQAILMLVAGVPAIAAIYVWGLTGTFYKQARMELMTLGNAPSIAIAVGWTVLLWSAWWYLVMPTKLEISLFAIPGWALMLSACLLAYESKGRLWVSWLLFAAWECATFVPRLLTAIGHL